MLVDAGVSSASTTAALRQHRIAAVLELAMERNPTGGNRSGAKAMTHCDALSSNTEDASVNEATIMRLLPWSYKGASHASHPVAISELGRQCNRRLLSADNPAPRHRDVPLLLLSSAQGGGGNVAFVRYRRIGPGEYGPISKARFGVST